MRWSRFLMLAVALIGVIALIILRTGSEVQQSILVTGLGKARDNVDARGDGSVLRYDNVKTKGDVSTIDELRYQDGTGDVSININNLSATPDVSAIPEGGADVVVITTDSAQFSFENLTFENLRPNPDPVGKFDQYDFDALSFDNLNIVALEDDGALTLLSADHVELDDLANRQLGRIKLENYRIGANAPLSFGGDELVLEDIDYGALDEILDALSRGDIPLGSLSRLGFGQLFGSAIDLDLGDDTIVDDGEVTIDEGDMLSLFLRNAPPELRDLTDTVDPDELKERFDDFSEQEPRDQAINALEFLLDHLKTEEPTE